MVAINTLEKVHLGFGDGEKTTHSFFSCAWCCLHFIIYLTHANVWESMGKPVCHIFYYESRQDPYQHYKSCENPYEVQQVTCAASERAIKLKVHMIKRKSLSP